jgi:predicted hydrocarbon binding protein
VKSCLPPNQDSKLNAVVLDDIDPEILDIILQHLYVRIPYNVGSHIERCETPEDVQEVVELIVASNRVGVLDLVKQAVVILKDMIEEVEWSEEDSEEIAPMITKAAFEGKANRAFEPVKSATAHFIAKTFREHEILRGAMNDLLGRYAELRMLVMSDSLLNSSPSVSTFSTSTIDTISTRPKLQRSCTSKTSTSSASS